MPTDDKPEGLELLLEAMTLQMTTLNELTEVTRSLAASEQRESFAELITALSNAVALPTMGPNRGGQPVGIETSWSPTDRLADQTRLFCDQLRASLGRSGSASFYVDVRRIDGRLELSGPALADATSVQVGDDLYPVERGSRTIGLVRDDDDSDEVGDPVVRVMAGGRVIAVGRPSSRPRLYDNDY